MRASGPSGPLVLGWSMIVIVFWSFENYLVYLSGMILADLDCDSFLGC